MGKLKLTSLLGHIKRFWGFSAKKIVLDNWYWLIGTDNLDNLYCC